MSLPAADLPAPIAVLVLAWDEATPAVRALVEATRAPAPTVESILVMVPQADAPGHLSAEEYLPLALPAAEIPDPAAPEYADVLDAAPAGLVAAAPPPPAPSKPLPAPASELPPNASEAVAQPPATAEDAPLATPLPTTGPPASPSQPPITTPAASRGWAAVRILRLGNYSLPQLAQRAGQPLPAPTWLGSPALPMAPYLGATPPAGPGPTRSQNPALPPMQVALPAPLASAIPSLRTLPPLATGFLTPTVIASPEQPARGLTLDEATEPRPQAADLEADSLETDFFLSELTEANELTTVEVPSPDLLAADDELAPTLPEQASWPEALATLRQPAAPPELAPVVPAAEPSPEAASATHPALRPAATHYPAPDLNFQIIQYARFAVPVALAEAPFAVIYAAAWPTWLAAQELRNRTGRPLVLHVTELAAPADESVETAAGWIAELQRQALHRADLLLAETPTLAQRLRHELGLRVDLVQAIPAADTAAIAQALHTARVRPVG
ncbi:glycosyltransferase [Hymenobacter cheonanensis]|uniref:glycosyltransferase n=1 Tax=Hymenobacter sp. CA2-7 TaxID=3063993 RepID=UPI0027123DEB|nr:glycosyltransferase [Hymenobacter sp. CA2-7]MDO7887481.1 glycosyltransferase [Hymenobacter sp. CA2-7]